MTTFVSNNVSSGSIIYAADHNEMGTRIGAVLNGGIDNTNINASAAIDGSKLASASVTNTQLDTSVSPVTRGAELIFDHVASGCVWTADAAGSTRLASMTAGVVYIGGKRVTVSAVTSRTFTASKDVYVDVDNTGTITYTDGTTNAASGALAANSIRLAIIVVGASSIAASTSINQGQEDRVLPIASSVPYAVTDSLGNLICPRDPNRKLLGLRQRVSGDFVLSAAQTTQTQVTELSCPVIVPTGRKVKITVSGDTIQNASASQTNNLQIWEGAVVSGTSLATARTGLTTASGFNTLFIDKVYTPSSSSKTYNVGVSSSGASNVTIPAGSGRAAVIKVELE